MALSRPNWRVEAAQANERQTCQTFLAPASPIFALAKLEDPEAAQANGVRHSRQKLVNWSPATYPRVSTVPVEFRDLRWAIVASKHRSLRQAAEALRIKQPTLSRGLRNLEYRLGVTLFKRTNGGTHDLPLKGRNSSKLPGVSLMRRKQSRFVARTARVVRAAD
ncbi:helix-turn-helix domain-containing protein [Bradyrhizobium diazoefficiens]|uniref:helix-turn-helix domain-containing protein n=1 Tax=Bradyrhizobium diazoefficiens TaxID=1355477 RepID=UPI003517BA52